MRLKEEDKHTDLTNESLHSELSEIQHPFMFGEDYMYMCVSSQRSSPKLLGNEKHCMFLDENVITKILSCVPLRWASHAHPMPPQKVLAQC